MTTETVLLDEDLSHQLDRRARLEHKTRSEVIVDVLRDRFRPRGRGLPTGAGAFASDRSDIAERADQMLADSGFGEPRDR